MNGPPLEGSVLPWSEEVHFDASPALEHGEELAVTVCYPAFDRGAAERGGGVVVWLPGAANVLPDQGTLHRWGSEVAHRCVAAGVDEIAGALASENGNELAERQLVTWRLDLSLSPGMPLMIGCKPNGDGWVVRVLDALKTEAARGGRPVRWWDGRKAEFEDLVSKATYPRVFSENFSRVVDRRRGRTYRDLCVKRIDDGTWVAIVGYARGDPNLNNSIVVRVPEEISDNADGLSRYVRTHPYLGARIDGLAHNLERPRVLSRAYGQSTLPGVFELSDQAPQPTRSPKF